jgi:hypothetical protein
VLVSCKVTLVRVTLKTTGGHINTVTHVRIVNTYVRTNTHTQISLTATVGVLASTVALTAGKGTGTSCPVIVHGVRVATVGYTHAVIICRREIIRVVVKRRRHVAAAEVHSAVRVTGCARIKVTDVTIRDNARCVVKIVGRRTLTGAAVRRAVIRMALTAVKVRT